METVIIRPQDTPSISCLFEVCATFRFSLFLKLDVKLLTLANQVKKAKTIRVSNVTIHAYLTFR